MNELKTTVLFLVGAAVLTAAAVFVDPGTRTPDIFSDQGEIFYPDFTDPQAPEAIEVIDYNDETATATPLKVELRDGKWLLPSHNDYPADAENRLADTAAAVIELKKDIVISERVEDHAQFGVIDPLDESAASLQGRGKRVTLKGAEDEVLADFIIGDSVEDKPGHRYVRVPGQRKTYAVQTDVDPSAKFQDWIETDLLKLSSGDIRRVAINHYRVDERMRMLVPGEKLTLTKNDEDKWRMSGGGAPDTTKMNDLTGAVDSLRIVDVQPKPEILTADLKARGTIRPSMQAAVLLQQKGFFLGGGGAIFGNEGELLVDSKDGVRYTLRFGEIASSFAGKSEGEEGEGESRYLLIAVNFSEARAKQYDGDAEKGKELYQELNNRFAGWYYVISGAEFNKLMTTRQKLR